MEAERTPVPCALADCGDGAQDTVEFALDGTSYEIDLCERHAEEIRDDIEDFVGPARPVSAVRRRPRPVPPAASTLQLADTLRAAGEAEALRREAAQQQAAPQHDAAGQAVKVLTPPLRRAAQLLRAVRAATRRE